MLTRAQLKERVTARKNDIAGKDSLISALRDKLSVTAWAEDESGHSYAVGDKRRYLTNIYRCVKAHTKALTRRPTDGEFWARE